MLSSLFGSAGPAVAAASPPLAAVDEEVERPAAVVQTMLVSIGSDAYESYEAAPVVDERSEQRAIEGRPRQQRGCLAVSGQAASPWIAYNAGRFVFVHNLLSGATDATRHFGEGQFPSALSMVADMELAVGFPSGRVHSTASKKTLALSSSAVVACLPLPGSEHLLLVCHRDGAVHLVDSRFAAMDPLFVSDRPPFVSTASHVNPRAAVCAGRDATSMACHSNRFAVATARGVVSVFALDVAEAQVVTRREYAFQIYFGAASQCHWSADGRLLCVAGQDDLVTVFDHAARRVVCRLEGHRSFVVAARFHPCTRNRLVSVGEDARMLFWDIGSVVADAPTTGAAAATTLPLPFVDLGCARQADVPLLRPTSLVQLGTVAADVAWVTVDASDSDGALVQRTFIVVLDRKGRLKTWERGADL